jgi:predicted nucleic-acid-binding protein
MIGLDTNILVRQLVQDDPGMPAPILLCCGK